MYPYRSIGIRANFVWKGKLRWKHSKNKRKRKRFRRWLKEFKCYDPFPNAIHCGFVFIANDFSEGNFDYVYTS